MRFMGLDVGTTGVKAAVFDEEGRIYGYGFQGYPIIFGDGQRAEQDAELVWESSKAVIRKAAEQAGGEVCALSVSVQGDAIIPIDRNLKPLHNCLLGMDYRGEKQAKECDMRFGAKKLFLKTGMHPHPINSIVKIMHFVQNEPQCHERVWKYTTYADFILLKLGADEAVVDYTMASRYMALDLHAERWDAEILSGIGVSEEYLSQPCPSGTYVGNIPDFLSEELGLRRGVKIFAGGHDQVCAALGAGLVRNNHLALDSHGTAEVLSTSFDEPCLNSAMFEGKYPCTLYAQEGRYFTFALNHTGGVLLQWFRDTMCKEDVLQAAQEKMDPYTYMICRAPMNRPSKVLALPYFNGSGNPHCSLDARGAFVGLDMNTDRGELTKAIMDSLAYEMKLNLQALRDAGIPVESIRCVGGAAKSEAWMQLKADILEKRIETLETHEAACLGAAMIGAVGVGAFASIADAADSMVRVKRSFEPDCSKGRIYEERYRIYTSLIETLSPISKDLSALACKT